jgi:RND family efflux transporter MFP subunit
MTTRTCALLALLLTAAACSSEADGAAGGPPARGGSRGDRPNSVTLAPTDVAVVRQQPVEDGPPITGNLQPLDRVDVRARLEGDLQQVLVREGQRVRAGQLLARFENVSEEGEAKSASADLASARTDLATARWNLDQTRELYEQGAVPERDVKTAEQQVSAAQARVAAAESRVTSSSTTLRDTRVIAPISGTVETRTASPGEHMTRGATILTLVRTDVLELAAAVPARDADQVTTGQPVHFVAGGRQYEGRVARVSPTVAPGSRSVTVYVTVPNEAGALKGGSFATGRVVSRTVPDALVAPIAAVHQQPDAGAFAWRIKGGELQRVAVEVGIVDEGTGIAQLSRGLAAGDSVVVGNVGTLGQGMKANVVGGDQSAGNSDRE